MLTILGKGLKAEEFVRLAKSYDFGKIKPDSLVIHHTWRPTKAEWKGASTLEGVRLYYEGLGWTAGPHLFVSENLIWLFTPMNQVGIHAGNGNAVWERLGKEYRGFKGPVGSRLKSYSIGIEVVGDYDAAPWTGKTKDNALTTIKVLMSVLGISTENVRLHRDFSQKSCPGWAITKDWLGAELAKLDSDGGKTGYQGEPSEWAKSSWEWQRKLGLDLSVSPSQPVSAEWVFAIVKKVSDLNKT